MQAGPQSTKELLCRVICPLMQPFPPSLSSLPSSSQTKVSPENCLGISLFARHLNLRHLELTCRRFAEENFVDVSQTEEFLEMPMETVQELIQRYLGKGINVKLI